MDGDIHDLHYGATHRDPALRETAGTVPAAVRYTPPPARTGNPSATVAPPRPVDPYATVAPPRPVDSLEVLAQVLFNKAHRCSQLLDVLIDGPGEAAAKPDLAPGLRDRLEALDHRLNALQEQIETVCTAIGRL